MLDIPLSVRASRMLVVACLVYPAGTDWTREQIPGADPVHEDQVVMVGAHLGSWAAGPPLSVAKLVELAKKGPALTRPPETRQSYPIPVLDGQTLRCAFLYAPQGRANSVEGLHLIAPTHLALLDAETGRFESIREVRPAEFGQADAPGDDIGAHRMPAGLTVETFYPEQARLFAAYDALLPAFAAGQRQFSREVRRAAAEFRRLFPWLAEKPLMPYYRTLGKEFFTWVDRIPSDGP